MKFYKIICSTKFENGVQMVVGNVSGKLAEKEQSSGKAESEKVLMVVPQVCLLRFLSYSW